MADEFTGNQVQGVFGQFVPVVDEALPLTDDNIQGVFGEFSAVLDEAATAGAPPTGRIMSSLVAGGGLVGMGGIAGRHGGLAG